MEDNKHTIINGHAVALLPQALAAELATYAYSYATPPRKVNGIFLKDDQALASRLRGYCVRACPTPSDLSDVVVLVRDPVQRFISYVSRYGLDVDRTISSIENGIGQTYPLRLREYLGDNNILFKYETHREEFLEYLGIDSLLSENQTDVNVSLTWSQLSKVQELFAEDISIYDSITSAGKLYVKTPEPIIEAPITFTLTKLAVRRKLRELGLEEKLDEFLNLNPQAKADWNDATQLASDDPIMINGIAAFSAASGLSEEQVTNILLSAV